MASQQDLPRALDVQRFAEARQAEVTLLECSCRIIHGGLCSYSLLCPISWTMPERTWLHDHTAVQIVSLEACVKSSGAQWGTKALPRHLRR